MRTYKKMKPMKSWGVFFACAVFAALLGACSSKSKPEKPESPGAAAIDAAHNARNSLTWAGRYTGFIPAADGPGINVQILLEEDGTYEVIYEYEEREGSFSTTGSFTWNDAGDTIILDDKTLPPYYWVGENTLTQLDMAGNRISGQWAEMYVLNKVMD